MRSVDLSVVRVDRTVLHFERRVIVTPDGASEGDFKAGDFAEMEKGLVYLGCYRRLSVSATNLSECRYRYILIKLLLYVCVSIYLLSQLANTNTVAAPTVASPKLINELLAANFLSFSSLPTLIQAFAKHRPWMKTKSRRRVDLREPSRGVVELTETIVVVVAAAAAAAAAADSTAAVGCCCCWIWK